MQVVVIQNRRGEYSAFDPSRLRPGEFAIVQSGDTTDSGMSVYICISAGNILRLVSADELEGYESSLESLTNRVEGVLDSIQEAVRKIEDLEDVSGAIETAVSDYLNEHPELMLTVQDGGVTTAKLADSAVTSTKIASGAVSTIKLEDSAVTTAKIGNLAVTEAKLAANAVTTGKIASGAVTEAKLADNSVSTAKIQDSAITTAKLNNSAVTTTKLADGSVTTDKLNSSAVTTDKIGANAVTYAKLGADVTTFSDYTGEDNIASGDTIKTIWGKIKFWINVFTTAITTLNTRLDNKVNKEGDTMTGNLSVSQASASSATAATIYAQGKTENGTTSEVGILCSATGNTGIYNNTAEEWLIYNTTSNKTKLPALSLSTSANGTFVSPYDSANMHRCFLRKIGNVVFMMFACGYTDGTTTIPTNTTLCTIPSEYRPSSTLSFPMQGNRSDTARSFAMNLSITATGEIYQTTANTLQNCYCVAMWEV